MNGTTNGDWEGEYTYVGARGATVIDHVIASENVCDKIKHFRIDDRVDSDHLPLMACMDGRTEEERIKEGKEEENEESIRISWTEEN